MIVEVRAYRIAPGRRDEFVEVFETKAVPALRAAGIPVLGPLLDLENPNRIVWMRAYESLADRERLRREFYGGKYWLEELEDVVMPMLESYDCTLCETSPGTVTMDVTG